jgi:uncharacterized tellurite resistance protein B-like protein
MLSKASEYAYLIPQNHKDRETQLGEMIDLALIDGELSPAEVELINMVGEKLGFSQPEVDQIVANYIKA